MSEPLLLVPGKPEEVCGDVRPVLQEVFRDAVYPAGPLGSTTPSKEAVGHNILNVVSGASDNNKLVAENWATKYHEECKELGQHEDELKKEYAQKLSRGAPLNTYKLHRRDDVPVWRAPRAGGRGAYPGGWRLQRGLLERRDLLPMVQQNAAGEESLWVRSLLARSSSAVPAATLPPSLPGSAPLPALDPIAQACACSMQSVSMGLEPVPVAPARPPPPPAPLAPQYIVCDPPELHFVNFDVGKLYVARVRIVNVTKQQVRVALRAPPPPLHVMLCGPSPLNLRAGATGMFEVQFRPRSVLSVRDEVRVRASLGRALAVRVYCYMEPPQLHSA